MQVHDWEIRKVAIPRTESFTTSLGTEDVHHCLVVRADTDAGPGWGECVAEQAPTYAPEYMNGCADVMREFLIPELAAAGDLHAADVGTVLGKFRGHPMAKSALEMALLDAELKRLGMPLSAYLGGVRERVISGVSVGVCSDLTELLSTIESRLAEGYQRLKLKIRPGWDLEPVKEVRREFGWELPLQVDANTAYARGDENLLTRLDTYDLLLLEQPFAPDDLLAHADLARRMRTPICLDESIASCRDAGLAVKVGACAVINIKPGRVGGYLEARRIHDFAWAAGVQVWCGGMCETGIGRAGNLALAALPGFTIANDISASRRYFDRDLTAPFEVEDGCIAVPTGSGLGVEVDTDALEDFTVETVRAPAR